VHSGTLYAGVRLVPGAAASLFGLDVPKLRDGKFPLRDLVDASAFEAAMRTADPADLASVAQSLSPVLHHWIANRARPADEVVDHLIARMLAGEDATIQQLTEGLGVSYRQALRRFQQATGLSPKEFVRLRRIREACVRALLDSSGVGAGWAGISAATGFADQSHLSREFGRTFGWPPTLVHEYLRRIEHRGVKA
jgi:transcriptional regulator GlxA family with amidase domain